MTKPILYCFGESGNAYRAALCMTLLKIDYEQKFVDFFKGEARSETFLKEVNPMGEVPALKWKGKIYTQSAVIMELFAREAGQFIGKTRDEDLEIMRWVVWDNQKLSGYAGPARFHQNFLPQKHRNEEVIKFLKGRMNAALKILEERLKNREWVATDHPTVADFSCASYLYYPEPFGFERSHFTNIDAWLARLSHLNGWQHPYDLMERAFQND